MRIHLGTDHAGLEFSTDQQHHLAAPTFCIDAARAVVRDEEAGVAALGIVFDGSGHGEQVAANMVDGVQATFVWSFATAESARVHTAANVITIGARQHPFDEVVRFIDGFNGNLFAGEERLARRNAQVAEYETPGTISAREIV